MNLGLLLVNLTAVGVGAVLVLMTAANYSRLPERIPIHFGFTGEPDNWGPRATIWLLPALGLVMSGMLFGLAATAGPAARLVTLLHLQTLALFLVITRDQMQVALGLRTRLSAGVWVLLGIVVLTSVLGARR